MWAHFLKKKELFFMGRINFKLQIADLQQSNEYKSLNLTTRDVYELIYKSFLASAINCEKGNEDWKDELGVFCRYNQSLIAQKLNKSLRTINYAIKKLKELGLIHVVEVGKRQTAKIYVKPIKLEIYDYKEVEIEKEEVKQVFEETFNETANYKESQALNNMIKRYSLDDLVTAIKKSVNVKFKKARINYIEKTIESLNNQKKSTKKEIRKEMTPDWLNKNDEIKPKIIYELTDERRNLISQIKDLNALGRDICSYSTEELKKLIKMQSLQKLILN